MFFSDGRLQDLVPIPADQVLHHFKQLRPGQIRCVPAIVQAMIKAKDFDEYDDAELQDANASIARLKAGLTSRKRILSEEGIDVREVDQENAEDKTLSGLLKRGTTSKEKSVQSWA